MDLKGKTALISGGSSGIGLAFAEVLVEHGASVCLLARRMEPLLQAKTALETRRIDTTQTVEVLSADVSDYPVLESVLRNYLSDHPVPDILLNSAGLVHPAKFINQTIPQYHQMMDVNFFGTVHLCKLIIPEMIKLRRGYVINISSSGGLFPVYGYTGYAASKFAVRGFTDSLRQEMRLLGIKVSIVYPPDTNTPQLQAEFPRRPIITQALAETNGVVEPRLVAEEILQGMHKSRYVILPGKEVKFLSKVANIFGFGIHPFIDLLTNISIRQKKQATRKKRKTI